MIVSICLLNSYVYVFFSTRNDPKLYEERFVCLLETKYSSYTLTGYGV